MTNTLRLTLLATALVATSGATAFAAPVLGLTGDKTLVMFDTESPR